MPKKTKPLYERGKYRLVYDRKRDGSLRSPHIQIVWYDGDAKRNRSRSTGTNCIEQAERQLDALYSENEKGRSVCHACGQAILAAEAYLLTDAIAAPMNEWAQSAAGCDLLRFETPESPDAPPRTWRVRGGTIGILGLLKAILPCIDIF